MRHHSPETAVPAGGLVIAEHQVLVFGRWHPFGSVKDYGVMARLPEASSG